MKLAAIDRLNRTVSNPVSTTGYHLSYIYRTERRSTALDLWVCVRSRLPAEDLPEETGIYCGIDQDIHRTEFQHDVALYAQTRWL